MKIAIFELETVTPGKKRLYDERLDGLEEIFKPKKTTPLQIECVGIEEVKDAEIVLTTEAKRTDLILTDLDYVQQRLASDISEEEKQLFMKISNALEKEACAYTVLTDEEKKKLKGYPLITTRPVHFIQDENSVDMDQVFLDAYYEAGRIAFFTGGPKEVRMWSVRKGATAYEAAGCIHSEIQAGFIRAEVANVDELLAVGHYNQVKNEGKIRLEGKEYVVQDGDFILFRSN